MFYDKKESESCLVKAHAEHTGESVLAVSELLCADVQRNAQEHKQGHAREMSSCWETVNTPPHVNRESGVTPNPQSLHTGAGHLALGQSETN